MDYLASQGWENVCKWGWAMRQSIHLSILPVQWGRTCKLNRSMIRATFGNQAKNFSTSKCENALCEQSKVLNYMIDFVSGPSSYKAVDPRGPRLCQSQWLLSCRGLSIFKWLSAIFVKCDHRQIYICKFWHNFATPTSVMLLTSNSTTSLWKARSIEKNHPSEKKYSLFILTGQQIYFICTICCGNLVHFSPTWNHLLNQWHLRWRECHLLTCLVITPDGHLM